MLLELLTVLLVRFPRDGSVHALEFERFEALKRMGLVTSLYFSLAGAPSMVVAIPTFRPFLAYPKVLDQHTEPELSLHNGRNPLTARD